MKLFRFFLRLLIVSNIVHAAEEPKYSQYGTPTSLGVFEQYPQEQRAEFIRMAAEHLSDFDLANWATSSKELHAILQPILDERLVKYWSSGLIRMIVLKEDSILGKSIWALAFSPDGLFLASAADKTIILWNVANREQIGQLQGHTDRISALAFSPRGNQLASGARDGSVRLWTISRTGSESLFQQYLQTVENIKAGESTKLTATGPVKFLAYSPRGNLIAAATKDTIIVWNTFLGTKKKEWEVCDPKAIAFSTDGTTVLVARGDYSIELLNVQTGITEKKSINLCKDVKISAAAFSPDRKLLALGVASNIIISCNVATGEYVRELGGHFNFMTALAFSADGSLLASSGYDGTVRLWNVKTGEKIRKLYFERPESLVFSPDNQALVGGGFYGVIFYWK